MSAEPAPPGRPTRRYRLAGRSASVLAHLERVAAHLPDDPGDLRPMSSATDTVVLHLWQAVQIVIDLAALRDQPGGRPSR